MRKLEFIDFFLTLFSKFIVRFAIQIHLFLSKSTNIEKEAP